MGAFFLLALLLLPAAASASTCAEEAEMLARQYGLTGAGTKAGPEERSTKPTPEAAPGPSERSPAEGSGSTASPAPPLDPERRAKMEASVAAARASDDEATCFRLLEDARSVSPGKAPAR